MKIHSASDQEVVEAIRRERDVDATIRYLYDAHFETLSNFIRSNSGREEDAEDFFQEALVVFIRVVKQGKFRGDSSVKTFLYAIMRNLWLNELKRRNKALVRETTYYEQSEQETGRASELVQENETTNQVLAFFERLGSNCKKILMMYYYQEMSMKDIAQAMNYDSEQVARNTKYKCSKKLTALLDSNPTLKSTFRDLLMHK